MGLENTQTGKYVGMSYGKFRVKTTSDNEKAEVRENQLGQKVYELVYNKLSNVMLKSVEKVEGQSDYGDQYVFAFFDKDEDFKLFINEGATANKFINKLINTKPNQDLTIISHYFEDTKKTEFTFIQSNEKVSAKYTREKPGDMPTLEKDWEKATKKEKTNFIIDLDEFFKEELMKFIQNIDILNDVQVEEPTQEDEGLNQDEPDDVNNDLPF